MAMSQEQDVEAIISAIVNKTFEEDDWNVVIKECDSLSASWENLSGYLGLSISLIDTIRGSFPNNPVRCWCEALKHWIRWNYNVQKFGLPSWRTLLEAVARVDRLLFKKLADTHQASGEVVTVPTSNNTGREMEVSEATAQAASISSPDVDKPQLSFPCLDLSKMDKEEKNLLHQRLYSESVDMIDKFQKLFSDTTESLKTRKISVKELVCGLVGLGPLPPAYKDLNLPMFMRQLPELTKSKTIDEAMLVIGNYCSFFNFRMIQHIINKLGTRQDKKNLFKYREEFNQYVERHVFECPSEVGTISKGLANMFVTLDQTFDGFTLRSLELFVESLRKVLKISAGAVFKLCRVEPGSLKLTFQLPYSMLADIFPLSSEQEAALASLGVDNLWLIYQFNRQNLTSVDGEETATAATNQGVDKQGDTASTADSGRETASVITAATFTGVSQLSEDIVERDLRDEPYLRMEQDAVNVRPPGGSSGLELHRASRKGELDKVKQLVEEKKLNPLQKDSSGDNALHRAAAGGHLPVVKYFIEEQSLVPACPGQRGYTPLHWAAYNNHLEVVKYLVAKQQVDPQCQDERGYTPLHRASLGGDVDVIRYLINEAIKLTPLKDVVYDRNKVGNTSIHFAALRGHLQVVKLFISEFNVDPNTPGQWGRPPLHYAAQEGHLDIVKYLVDELKCDPSYCSGEDKVTPLHMASRKGRLDVVKYLTMEKHCNPLNRNSLGNTPLHLAALSGHLKVVEFFFSQLNCDPNTPGQQNGTPLQAAAQEGHLDIVKYLIEEKNCNPSHLDERKMTPLHSAAYMGHLNIVQYLTRKQHCNPLCYDKVLGTPLHWAAWGGHLKVVKYFIGDLKCPQNIRGPRNTTPLEEAHSRGHTNVVQYLMSVM